MKGQVAFQEGNAAFCYGPSPKYVPIYPEIRITLGSNILEVWFYRVAEKVRSQRDLASTYVLHYPHNVGESAIIRLKTATAADQKAWGHAIDFAFLF